MLYTAMTSTENPPLTDWRDVTTSPSAAALGMKAYPGTCKKMATRVCPSKAERCERIAITLTGSNFGVKADDWQLQLAPQVSERISKLRMDTINVSSSEIVYFSHSAIQFSLPPGQGYRNSSSHSCAACSTSLVVSTTRARSRCSRTS